MKTSAIELLYNQPDAFTLIARVVKRLVENNILRQEQSHTSPIKDSPLDEAGIVLDVAEKELRLAELRKLKAKKQKQAQAWLNYKP